MWNATGVDNQAMVRLGAGEREAQRGGQRLTIVAAAVGGGANDLVAERVPPVSRDYEYWPQTSEALIQIARIHRMLHCLAPRTVLT